MQISKRSHGPAAVVIVVLLFGCSEKPGAHTTVVVQVPPPPRQILTIVSNGPASVPRISTPEPTADKTKPLLIFNLENGSKFRTGEEVPLSFQVLNAKMKSEGGEFRIRYIVDDDDMKWRDSAAALRLTGWLPGNHTIRVELIGPDGWPYRNGQANVVTREIVIEPPPNQ